MLKMNFSVRHGQNAVKKQGTMRNAGGEQCDYVSEGEVASASSGGYSEQNAVKKQGTMRNAGGKQCDYVSEGKRSHLYVLKREGVEALPYCVV